MLTHQGDAMEAITQRATTRSSAEIRRERKPRTRPTPGLPAASTAATSTAARETAASKTARAAGAWGSVRDGARDVGVHRLQAAREQRRLEGRVARIPAAGGARIDPFERLRPKGHAAEDDRVWKQLREDLRLRGELLAVLLGGGHVETEPERVLEQLAAGGRALRHEGKGDGQDQAGEQDGGSDEAPSEGQAESDTDGDASDRHRHTQASPLGAGPVRPGREELSGGGVGIDLVLGYPQGGRELSFEL